MFNHLNFRFSLNCVTYYALIIAFFLYGCKNETDEVVPVIDETNEILLAGTESKIWLITSSKKNGIEWLPDCMKDDEWKFTRSGTFSRTSTNLSCTNGIPDTEHSNWYFTNNKRWLTFGGGTYEITSLKEDEMILTFPKPSGETFVDTWIKK